MYMTIADAYGESIQPYYTATRDSQRIKSKLTYHCSFICQWILAYWVVCLYCHPSVCSVCNVIHHSPPSAFQQNYSFINIHFPALYQLHIFQNLFFHLLDYSNNKQTFLHVIKIFSFICTCMYIAIVCELHICKEGQPYKRIKSQFTYHCSFIRQWILACCVLHLHSHPQVCSVCMLIHHSPPSAF